MTRAAIPLHRGQGNIGFRTSDPRASAKRGQVIPYDVNGAPPAAPGDPGFLALDINDLPLADSAKPLFEFVMLKEVSFTGVSTATAGVAATASTVLRLFKNGVANGTITFVGATGTVAFSDSTYTAGSLFALFPPLETDAALDRVRISLETAA